MVLYMKYFRSIFRYNFVMPITMLSFIIGMMCSMPIIKELARMDQSLIPAYLHPVPVGKVHAIEIDNIDRVDEFDIRKRSLKYATKEEQQAIDCLSQVLFLEARNQSYKGRVAIARVIKNRVRDKHFPNNVCDVIKEGPTELSEEDKSTLVLIKERCQFSALCNDEPNDPVSFLFNKKGELIYAEHKAWDECYQIAKDIVLHNRFKGLVRGAINYHAHYVKPNWHNLTPVITIGDHIFYARK